MSGTGVTGNRPAVSAIVRTVFDTASSSVVSTETLRLDGSSGARYVVGVSGIAIGDVLPSCAGDELVVTSMLWDFLVLRCDGGDWKTIVEHTWFEGSLGVANAIVIDDLDPNVAGNEVYLAGSTGMRKLVRTP